MPEDVPSIRTSMFFLGNFDPDEVTRQTNLTPARAWRSGDPTYDDGKVRSSMKFDCDGWRYTIAESEAWSFEKHIPAIVELLKQNAPRLAEARAATGADLVLRLAGFTPGSTPDIRLPPELVSALAAIGASVEVDISHAPYDDAEESSKA